MQKAALQLNFVFTINNEKKSEQTKLYVGENCNKKYTGQQINRSVIGTLNFHKKYKTDNYQSYLPIESEFYMINMIITEFQSTVNSHCYQATNNGNWFLFCFD